MRVVVVIGAIWADALVVTEAARALAAALAGFFVYVPRRLVVGLGYQHASPTAVRTTVAHPSSPIRSGSRLMRMYAPGVVRAFGCTSG